MSLQDRVLLIVASASGCVCCWLSFQSVTQWTLRPVASATDLAFLAVVTGAIVAILVARRGGGIANGRSVAVTRRPLLVAGGLAALTLLILSRLFEGIGNPGDSTIEIAQEATLAGFAGVGVLGILLRMMTERLATARKAEAKNQDAEIDELAPGPFGDIYGDPDSTEGSV